MTEEQEQYLNTLLLIEQLARDAKNSPEVMSYLEYIILIVSMRRNELELKCKKSPCSPLYSK